VKSTTLGAIAIAVLLGASTVPAQGPVLVLEGGTLIDGTGRPPVTDAVVVVQGNRIQAVGRRGQVQVPAGATIIQTSGRTILPGLIDTHVHLRDWHVPMFLPYGQTTIADIHNDTKWSISQRDLLKSGKMKGPRMFVSGARVTGLGGPPVSGPDGKVLNDPSYVKDVAEARTYVRYLKDMGVDHIKVDRTITDEQLSAVLEEARKLNLRVFGHTRNIKVAVDMGMKHMEHMDTMARALLEQEGKNPTPAGTTSTPSTQSTTAPTTTSAAPTATTPQTGGQQAPAPATTTPATPQTGGQQAPSAGTTAPAATTPATPQTSDFCKQNPGAC